MERGISERRGPKPGDKLSTSVSCRPLLEDGDRGRNESRRRAELKFGAKLALFF